MLYCFFPSKAQGTEVPVIWLLFMQKGYIIDMKEIAHCSFTKVNTNNRQ